MMHATGKTESHGLRSLSDEEVLAVSGADGSGPQCLPLPPPTTGSTAGIYLFPLVYCRMN
jgi:hypothetical protein